MRSFLSCNFVLALAMTYLISLSTSYAQKLPIPIDTKGEVFDFHFADNGMIYYIQDGNGLIYRKTSKIAWLKMFDGYKTYALHKLDISTNPDNVINIIEENTNTLRITTNKSNYRYKIASNKLEFCFDVHVAGSRYAQFVNSSWIYSVWSPRTCFSKVENGSHKLLFCNDSISSKFAIYEDNFLGISYEVKGNKNIYVGWEIYDFNGTLKSKISIEEYNQLYPDQRITSSYFNKFIETKEGIVFKNNDGHWFLWDGNNFPVPYKNPLRRNERRYLEKGQVINFQDGTLRYNHLENEVFDLKLYNKKEKLKRDFGEYRLGDISQIKHNGSNEGIWVASKKGLFEIELFQNEIQTILENHSIRCITPYDEKHLLIGKEVGTFDLVSRTAEDLSGLEIKNTSVQSRYPRLIHRFDKGFVVASRHGIHKYLGDKLETIKAPMESAIYEYYGDNKLIYANHKQNLASFDINTDLEYRYPNSTDTSYRMDMLLLENDHIALASHKGLLVYDLKSEERILVDRSIPNALSLYKTDNTGFYIGYENGIIKKFIKERNTYREGATYSIGEAIATMNSSDKENLWLGTFNGIAQLNVSNGKVEFLDMDLVSHYECNRYSSFYDSAHEKIYIGTVKGLNIIPTNLLFGTSKYFDLKFSQISYPRADSIFYSNVFDHTSNKITLQSNQRSCKLAFTTSDILKNGNKQYQHRINGGTWSAFSKSNELNISYLQSGNNTVEIVGKSSGGFLSQNVLTAEIFASPFFYETWWFRSGLLLLILGIATFWFRRIKSENKRLERTVSERTSELKVERETIERQAAELLSLDKLKNQFFANISHELRTPLTLLISPLDKMRNDTNLTESQRYLMLLMKDNGRLLEGRIEELLELSRLNAKEVTLARQVVNLQNLIDFTTRIFLPKMLEKDISYAVEVEGTNINVICDEKRLSKIIQNLIGNALKFTPKNGSIGCSFIFNEGNLSIRIKDTGKGIIESELKMIFTRFYQGNTDNTLANPGTGIGLAMVQEYVHLMNGQIEVTSAVGIGSTFKVILPIELASIDSVEDIAYDVTPAALRFKPIKSKKLPSLLIVEDNESLRIYIKQILAPFFDLLEATNGIEALALLESRSEIDIILSDIMMPEMDGVTLLNNVRNNNQLKIKPFIFLTAKYNEEDLIQAYRMGVDDYVKKPFNENELLHRINAVYQNYCVRVEAKEEPYNDIESESTSSDSPSFIKTLHALVLEHLNAHDFSIDMLAEKLDMSRRHLQRIVKKEIGMSPKDYIREVKLNKARNIFESGQSKDPKEVARMVGFSTPPYFLKLYHERFGSKFGG